MCLIKLKIKNWALVGLLFSFCSFVIICGCNKLKNREIENEKKGEKKLSHTSKAKTFGDSIKFGYSLCEGKNLGWHEGDIYQKLIMGRGDLLYVGSITKRTAERLVATANLDKEYFDHRYFEKLDGMVLFDQRSIEILEWSNLESAGFTPFDLLKGVRIRDKVTKEELFVVFINFRSYTTNTEKLLKALGCLRKWLKTRKVPVLLLGDFGVEYSLKRSKFSHPNLLNDEGLDLIWIEPSPKLSSAPNGNDIYHFAFANDKFAVLAPTIEVAQYTDWLKSRPIYVTISRYSLRNNE